MCVCVGGGERGGVGGEREKREGGEREGGNERESARVRTDT